MVKSCATCKYWRGGFVCDAYPDGIPWPIQSGDIAHDESLPDDGGIQWEAKDDASKSIDAQEADTEQPPFTMTDGSNTRERWQAAIKALQLQLDPGDDDAAERVYAELERRGETAIMRAFREQWKNLLPPNAESMNLDELMAYVNARLIEQQPAVDAIARVLYDAAGAGVNVALDQLERIGIGFDYTLVNTRAQTWAQQYAGELIRGISDTTQAAVRQAVERWYGNGEPLSALVDDLARTFDRKRARLIAATETTRASSQGNLLGYKESGVVTGLVFKTANDERVCPWCGSLDGKIVSIEGGSFYDELPAELKDKMRRRFDVPPVHPNCRCRISAQVVEPAKSFVAHRGRPGHVGGSLPRNAAAVSQAEQEIFGASKENAVIIDTDGNVVLRKSGTKDRIAFTQDDAKSFAGNVFTHNHPNPEGYSGCVSFSDLDVQMASTYKVREMRAIGDKWAYSLQLADDLEWKEINKAFQKTSKQVRAEWQPLIVSKEMSVKDANANFHHEVWSRVGNAIGNDRFNYERYEHGY